MVETCEGVAAMDFDRITIAFQEMFDRCSIDVPWISIENVRWILNRCSMDFDRVSIDAQSIDSQC